MPKILINERDRTSPGTPDSYGNIAVLITGFLQTTFEDDATKTKVEDRRKKAIDSNGVFEINSVSDFEKIIGKNVPEIFSVEDAYNDFASVDICHYGHKIAYELVNMGYPIIYKPLEFDSSIGETAEDAIVKMSNADFWEIFKDKASYDFRFVSHGLVTSCAEYNKHLVDFIKELDDLENEVYGKKTKLNKVLLDLNTFKTDVLKALSKEDKEDPNFSETAAIEAAWDDADENTTSDYGKNNLKSIYNGTEYENAFEKSFSDTIDHFTSLLDDCNSDIEARREDIANINLYNLTTDVFNKINVNIANLATYQATGDGNTNDMYMRSIPGRGDCVALLELDEYTYAGVSTNRPENDIIASINVLGNAGINDVNGAYCSLTVPSVYYKGPNDTTLHFPAAFHYLACFMNAKSLGFREWYAIAGYTRGVSSYAIAFPSVKLGEIAINALEPRNKIDDQNLAQPTFSCNVIANFRGSYYLWGNRTAEPLQEYNGGGDLIASHFLNIRQLCSTIKKQLYTSCRRFTFDPNSDTLWVNFCNSIKPTLELMKADQGIRDYKIIKVPTDKKAMLKAKIRIIPIEAVEDFDIEVSLEDSFGETAVIAN